MFERGRGAARDGDIEGALAFLEQAATLAGAGDVFTYACAALRRFELLVTAERWDEAEGAFEDCARSLAIDFPPGGALTRLHAAHATWLRAIGSPEAAAAERDATRLQTLDRVEKACVDCNVTRDTVASVAAVDAYPGIGAARARYLLGASLAQLGEMDDAIEKLDQALVLGAQEGDGYTCCNAALQRFTQRVDVQRLDEAEEAHQVARGYLEDDQHEVLVAHLALLETAAGQLFASKGRSVDAAAAYERASVFYARIGSDRDAELHATASRVERLFALGETALSQLPFPKNRDRVAVREWAETMWALVFRWLSQGQDALAEVACDLALEQEKHIDGIALHAIRFLRGMIRIRRGELDAARADLDAAELGSDSAGPYAVQARVERCALIVGNGAHLETTDLDFILSDLAIVGGMSPVTARLVRAQLAMFNGVPEEAMRELDRAASEGLHDSQVLTVQLLRASALEQLGRSAEAMAVLDAAECAARSDTHGALRVRAVRAMLSMRETTDAEIQSLVAEVSELARKRSGLAPLVSMTAFIAGLKILITAPNVGPRDFDAVLSIEHLSVRHRAIVLMYRAVHVASAEDAAEAGSLCKAANNYAGAAEALALASELSGTRGAKSDADVYALAAAHTLDDAALFASDDPTALALIRRTRETRQQLVGRLVHDHPEAALREAILTKSSALLRLIRTRAQRLGLRPETTAVPEVQAARSTSVPNPVVPDGAQSARRTRIDPARLEKMHQRLTDIDVSARRAAIERAVDTRTILTSLAGDEAVVEYFATAVELYAFVLTERGLAVHALGLNPEVSTKAVELGTLVRERPTIARRVRRARWRELARSVHAWLLPFADDLHGYRSLRLSPGASMSLVPFAALVDAGGTVLGERHAVSYLLSAAQVATQTREAERVERAVLLRGDDAVGSAAPLSFADVELDRAAESLSAGRVAVADLRHASWGSTQEALAGAHVVHYAGHAAFEEGHAMAGGLFLDGRVVNALDLAAVDLHDAALVILSGCETARVAGDVGDEYVGLLRGVFAAGARAVLATGWLADDHVAAELVRRVYEQWLAGAPLDEALARSAAAIRAAHDDPYYWANFAAYGERIRRGEVPTAPATNA